MRTRSRTISRRDLLRRTALGAIGLGLGPSFLLRRASARASSRVLVAIFQRGAVDGLNMVVPHGDADYYRLRRSIGIPPPGEQGGAVDLDGFFGLHPSLAPLLGPYEAGELAIVHACGSPDPTRSHFDAQDFMETGSPGDKTTREGWLARHLLATGPAPGARLRAVALAGALPRALAGAPDTYAATTLSELALGRSRQAELAVAALERMYRGRGDLLGETVEETLANFDLFAELGGRDDPPRNGASYPPGALGAQLREVARVIRAGIGVEVAYLNTSGWDTHANEGGSTGTLAGLLAELAAALVAFRRDLGDAMADVCVLTMSEFGRTAAENGSRGTDHGHGTAMLVLGGTVSGGRVFGRWPGLASDRLFEGRDLAVTTDFRALFGEIVERHLGNPDVASVFPGFAYGADTRPGVIA